MFDRHQLRLLLLSVAIVTLSTQPVFLLGAAFFEIGPEIGLGALGLGALTAVFFLTSSLSSLALGRWVQSVGWRPAMRINAAVSGGLLLVIAGFARSVWSLGALLVLSAAVYGMANPAANLSLARHTDPRRAATVFGFKHAGIPASTLLAGLAVPAVIVQAGWRSAFATSAVLAVVVWWLIPGSEGPPPEHYAEAPARGRPLDRLGIAGLSMAAALGAVAATALGTFMVSAAVDIGFSESAGGVLQFVGSGASIVMRVLAGAIFDRRGLAGYSGLIGLMAIGAGAFASLPLAEGGIFAGLVILAYMTGWGWPGLMTYTVVDANRRLAASSSAVVQAGVFVGAGAGPLGIGIAVDRVGYDAVWLIVMGCLVAGTIILGVTYRQAFGVRDRPSRGPGSPPDRRPPG